METRKKLSLSTKLKNISKLEFGEQKKKDRKQKKIYTEVNSP